MNTITYEDTDFISVTYSLKRTRYTYNYPSLTSHVYSNIISIHSHNDDSWKKKHIVKILLYSVITGKNVELNSEWFLL
jgi:hypothetical protein